MCCPFFSLLWCLKFFFFLFKPCCFGTPWAFKPLGGRYGLVFEYPAAHREAHKQLAHIQCTVSPDRTHTHTHAIVRTRMKVFIAPCFFFLHTRKDKRWMGKVRMKKGRAWGGRWRGQGGGRGLGRKGGSWSIIACHSIWSRAKTHAVNNLWWFSAELVVVALKI